MHSNFRKFTYYKPVSSPRNLKASDRNEEIRNENLVLKQRILELEKNQKSNIGILEFY